MMDKAFKFLTSFLLGSLIGASLALIFAPDSGKNLRLQINEKVNRMIAEVKQAGEERRVELEEQLAQLRKPQV
jgi:gas vesicle protein